MSRKLVTVFSSLWRNVKSLRLYSSPKDVVQGLSNVSNFRTILMTLSEDYWKLLELIGANRKQFDIYVAEIRSDFYFNRCVWEKLGRFKNYLTDYKYKWTGEISEETGVLLYAIMRYLKPTTVLETGVANGISTAYILSALKRNKQGRLFSVDFPCKQGMESYFNPKEIALIPSDEDPGWVIPPEFKKRWQLILGRTSEQLVGICKRLGRIDVFYHDSEHSYQNMWWEYSTVWPFLKQKAILLSHDVRLNNAFTDFCNHKNLPGKSLVYKNSLGMLSKAQL